MMVHSSVGTIISQATDNQRINYSRLQVEIENYTPLNPATDNISKSPLEILCSC